MPGLSTVNEVLIFTPTSLEHEAVKRHVSQTRPANFRPVVVECGPGKINAAFTAAANVLPRLGQGRRPLLLIGAGTCGSLSVSLYEGEVIASADTIISDWKMEEGELSRYAGYGKLDFQNLEPQILEDLAITCRDNGVMKLLASLESKNFHLGRLLTSDTFVAGLKRKKELGLTFSCLACDMESGAFAYTAQKLLGGLPWLNFRVVADTLDEGFHDYVQKEINVVEVLGAKVAEALMLFDEICQP